MIAANGILLEFIKPGDRVEVTYVEKGHLVVREGVVSTLKQIRNTLTLLFDGGVAARTLRDATGEWATDLAITGHAPHRTPGTWFLLNDEEVLRVSEDGFHLVYDSTAVTYSEAEGDSMVELIPKPTSQAFDMPLDLFEALTVYLHEHGPVTDGIELARNLTAIYGPTVSARRARAFATMQDDPDSGNEYDRLTPEGKRRVDELIKTGLEPEPDDLMDLCACGHPRSFHAPHLGCSGSHSDSVPCMTFRPTAVPR